MAIRQAVDVDRYIEKGQIEILDYKEWYTRAGEFNAEEVLKGWVEKENQAVKKGFDGLRLSGNTLWLEDVEWRAFLDYEVTVNGIIGEHRMLALCGYSLGKCGSSEIIEVISAHQSALIRRDGKWAHIESTEKRIAQEEILKVGDFYKSILDGIIGGVWVTDKDDIIRYTNKGMTIIAGIVQEQIVGARLEDFPESGFKSLKPFYLLLSKSEREITTGFLRSGTCNNPIRSPDLPVGVAIASN
ncbi:MAG: MEDS domain-containing protein [Pseudomonadota bacterium]